MSEALAGHLSLADELKAAIGSDHVSESETKTRTRNRDLSTDGAIPSVVVEPASADEVSACVQIAQAHGAAVVPRGGGMSYTEGIIPPSSHSVVIETRRLNNIIEINEQDMFVTVGAGVTWSQLHEALKDRPVRPSFWGTGSGMYATVGGAASQNAMYLGSASEGPASDSVLGLTVCLADGTIVTTGSGAAKSNASPFFRTYGPDLTGLFLADAGAFGVKTSVTLRLLPRPGAIRFCSFEYVSLEDLTAAVTAIGNARIASECSGYDPEFIRLRIAKMSFSRDLNMLKEVITGAPSLLTGLADAWRVVVAGRHTLERGLHTMHVTLEGADAAEANGRLKRARQIGRRTGREILSTLPRLARSRPFREPFPVFGPEGRLWLPVNVVVPNSRVKKTFEKIDAFIDSRKPQFESLNIDAGSVVLPCGPGSCLIETNFFFPDEAGPYVEEYFSAESISDIPRHSSNPAAREAVQNARKALAREFSSEGGVHFQIGRLYPFAETRDPAALGLLESIKRGVDTHSLMNPGALGLGLKHGEITGET